MARMLVSTSFDLGSYVATMAFFLGSVLQVGGCQDEPSPPGVTRWHRT
jgi:hypothetical protein